MTKPHTMRSGIKLDRLVAKALGSPHVRCYSSRDDYVVPMVDWLMQHHGDIRVVMIGGLWDIQGSVRWRSSGSDTIVYMRIGVAAKTLPLALARLVAGVSISMMKP